MTHSPYNPRPCGVGWLVCVVAGGVPARVRVDFRPIRSLPVEHAARVPSKIGTASWYGPGFHGNRTSSGEIYDQNDLTAAHQTLPLGTRVAVTNLQNGRSVEVRVNDRGPFVEGSHHRPVVRRGAQHRHDRSGHGAGAHRGARR